jgi:uncharacterized protein YciI
VAADTGGACRTAYAGCVDAGRYLILFYDYVADIVERRAPHRSAHLALVQGYKADGVVVAGGALGDPVTGAAIVFATDDEDEIRRFVDRDPYIRAELITDWRIVPWTVVT